MPRTCARKLRLVCVTSGMDWHRDDLLYTKPQCELVLTLENDSDSYTEWIDSNEVC
jgi:hypothetical protein